MKLSVTPICVTTAELTGLFAPDAAGKRLQTPMTVRPNLMNELAAVKKRGYAISDGELSFGVWAMSAPIFDASGAVRAAMSATGPRPKDDEEIAAALKRSAREISQRLAAVESIKQPRR